MNDEAPVLLNQEDFLGLVTLNRPAVLNALSPTMLEAIADGLESLASDPAIRVLILTGGDRVFAAGADIRSLAPSSSIDVLEMNTRAYWKRIRQIEKPLIAAVSGYAYGGGCELAMLCDLIVASETARFAQPEIKLGIMPGAGGTQRLASAIGPYRAMEMVLTGNALTGAEAHAVGLVNRLVPVERLMEESMLLASQVAQGPPLAVRLAREAVRYGVDHTVAQGLEIERRNYMLLFDTNDQAEGMAAFLEKRPPTFLGE